MSVGSHTLKAATRLKSLSWVTMLVNAKRFAQGLGETAAAIDANYVRRADAELFWVDK